jgi:quinol monooxygenase YgiN
MPMFAVVVHLSLHEGTAEDFLPLLHTNARASLDNEPGCHRFDVVTDTARPEDVFLYELYTDAAAFDAHLATAHFKTFDAACGPLIADKTIKTYDRVRT